MEVGSILASTKSVSLAKLQQKEGLSKFQSQSQPDELVNSKTSLAAKSYAASQINFGNYGKLCEKIRSGNSNVSFDELICFYKYFGFTPNKKGNNIVFHKNGHVAISATTRNGKAHPKAIGDAKTFLNEEVGVSAHI